jgi:hypothetical protein
MRGSIRCLPRQLRCDGRFGLVSMAAQIPSPLQAVAAATPDPAGDGAKVVPQVKVSPDLMGGDVEEGYGKVADVFRRNRQGRRCGRHRLGRPA